MSVFSFNNHLPEQNLLQSENIQRGKGRIVSFDPRDKQYNLRGAAPSPFAVTRDKWFWGTGQVLNQGSTFHCVAYSSEQFLMSEPVKNAMYKTPKELYKLCQLNDEWPGEEPAYSGTSVRAAMKVLQAAGLIGTYAWAFDAETVRRWVLMKGPVIVGTNWYSDMYKPNPVTNFIRPTGKPDGGHAYMIRGADDTVKSPDGTRGAFRIINSWGEAWGQQGKAWISYKDMDGLIKNQGEAVTATEVFNRTPKLVTGVIK
jgi:C1A family cysteine protease